MLDGSAFSRPKKLVRLASSELVRLRDVVLSSLAVSATRDVHRDHIADMHGAGIMEEALRARLPQ